MSSAMKLTFLLRPLQLFSYRITSLGNICIGVTLRESSIIVCRIDASYEVDSGKFICKTNGQSQFPMKQKKCAHQFALGHITLTRMSASFGKYGAKCIVPQSLFSTCSLLESQKGGAGSSGKKQESESDSDSESDYESDDDHKHYKEDKDFPSTYKELSGYMKSPRLDSIISLGLSVSKTKAEEYLLSSMLKVNGKKALKKSKQLEVGDYTDLVVGREDHILRVKRVRVLSVSGPRSSKDKLFVRLRVWRSVVNISEDN